MGGRIGAARGPEAFKKQWARLKADPRVQKACVAHTILDQPLPFLISIEERYVLAIQEIKKIHDQSGLSVVIGAGHDHGYSQLAALKGKKSLGCINIDAHLDLRPSKPHPTSGSPFYMAIERGVLRPKNLIEFGVQQHCNSPELWEYARKKKISIVPFEKVRNGKAVSEFKKALRVLSKQCDQIVVSLDLDGLSEAFAPGVSAPQAQGFSSDEVLEMLEVAGANPKVISLGIFELNPLHDREDQTARLAALSAWTFVSSALT